MAFDYKEKFSVAGKKCIVTGAAQGLSRGMAEGLLENGAEVVLMDLQACLLYTSILKDSAKSSAMILFIIASSTAFSWVFTFSGASQALVDTVVAMNLNSTLFCFVVAIILLIFGTFMEGTAIAVLLVPVLWPIAQSMGIDVIHFGMIVCISNVVGTMTPPVAVNIFSASTVSGLKMGDIAKAEIPFLIGYVAVFFLCVFSRGFCTMLI